MHKIHVRSKMIIEDYLSFIINFLPGKEEKRASRQDKTQRAANYHGNYICIL